MCDQNSSEQVVKHAQEQQMQAPQPEQQLQPQWELPPLERLLVCTDNCSDEALLRRADERVIYTSRRHEQWWLARFPAQDFAG